MSGCVLACPRLVPAPDDARVPRLLGPAHPCTPGLPEARAALRPKLPACAVQHPAGAWGLQGGLQGLRRGGGERDRVVPGCHGPHRREREARDRARGRAAEERAAQAHSGVHRLLRARVTEQADRLHHRVHVIRNAEAVRPRRASLHHCRSGPHPRLAARSGTSTRPSASSGR